MALTVLTAPANTCSVSNDMIFVIDESVKAHDDVTYPNYRYVLDIYVASTLVARMKVPPDPTYGFGIFDISKVLQNYVPDYTLKATYSNLTESYAVKVSYQCKLGEEYSDTLYTNLVTDSTRTTYRTYIIKPSGSGNTAPIPFGYVDSNMPRDLKGYKDDYWFIVPFIANVSGQTLTGKFYDSAGAQVGSNVSFGTYTTVDEVLQINAGFQKLSTNLGLSTAQKSSVVNLKIDNSSGDIWTVEYICDKYPVITLAWLNPYGAYESYSFGYVSKKSKEISRKEYARPNYNINASGEVSYSSEGVIYGSKRSFTTLASVIMKLTSHILTQGEYTWLADLFSSTDVYMYDSAISYFVPVKIKDNNYEYQTYLNSRLKPLEFSIEFSQNYNAQNL